MNARLLCCVSMGVFTTYIGIVMLMGHFRPAPRSEAPFKPNFRARAAVVVDKDTGEKTIYQEITVTTKLAAPTIAVVPPVVEEGAVVVPKVVPRAAALVPAR